MFAKYNITVFFILHDLSPYEKCQNYNKYAYKSFKSIHTIYYYIIPNNVIGGQANKTYIISITQMI